VVVKQVYGSDERTKAIAKARNRYDATLLEQTRLADEALSCDDGAHITLLEQSPMEQSPSDGAPTASHAANACGPEPMRISDAPAGLGATDCYRWAP
jgi:hypothetical protein